MCARSPSLPGGMAVVLCATLALGANATRADDTVDAFSHAPSEESGDAAVSPVGDTTETIVMRTAADSEPPARAVAIVIGNNRSRLGTRADLRYADDDALRTTETLRALVPGMEIALLTRVDDESARLHPELALEARAPTRAAFDDSIAKLAETLEGARAAQQRTELFLVFAGHGERDASGGYLELEDDTLRRADLLDAIARISPTRAHVVLDACNSFFVVHARRPGGRPFVLSHEVEQGLDVPGVDVGVLLSTSADAQVYEWSDLSGGVFSHAFRSGLLGPADADDDGSISYREMKAFIEIATRDVPNAEYRPHLFMRAPESDRLVTLPKSTRLPDDSPQRVTARDARGVRLADVRLEDGFRPRLVLPGAAPFALYGVYDEPGGPRAVNLAHDDDAHRFVAQADADHVHARGAPLAFARLFESPFGPRALVTHEQMQTEQPPLIYGLSRAQEERLSLHLASLADMKRRERLTSAFAVAGLLATAPLFAAPLALTLALDDTLPAGATPLDDEEKIAALALLGLVSLLPAAVGLAYGAWTALVPSAEEDIHARFVASEKAPSATEPRAVSAVDTLREKVSDEERLSFVEPTILIVAASTSLLFGVSALAYSATVAFTPTVSGGVAIADGITPDEVSLLLGSATLGGGLIALGIFAGALAAWNLFVPEQSATARTLALIEGDPDRPLFLDGEGE